MQPAELAVGTEFRLSLYIFPEDSHSIAYCPALDLSGYGADEGQAREDLAMVMEEYFEYTVEKKTLHEDLKRLGWTMAGREMTPPNLAHMQVMNEDFNQVLNNESVKRVEMVVQIPVIEQIRATFFSFHALLLCKSFPTNLIFVIQMWGDGEN